MRVRRSSSLDPACAAATSLVLLLMIICVPVMGQPTSGDSPAESPLSAEITVTGARAPTRLDETPGSVAVLTRESIDTAASPALDDALRSLPGFTLFRRSGSRTANPTSQGVSLRGVGATGASRSLVLDDGIPLNDPFGGWIYWGRIPREAVERVEVLRGGGSDLYGANALTGVLNVLRLRSQEDYYSASAAIGSHRSRDISVLINERFSIWTVRGALDAFDSEGYVIVAEGDRGPVDVPARSERVAAEATLERDLRTGRMFARLSAYREERGNGTPLQTNATDQLQLSAGSEFRVGASDLTARVFISDQEYEQSFSAIATDRATEQLTRLQEVPSDSLGTSVVARRAASARTLLIGGIESRRVRGTSRERILGVTPVDSDTGGRQETFGLFAEALIQVNEWWNLSMSARGEAWKNLPEGGQPARAEEAFSPRLTVTRRLGDSIVASGSAYRSFRPPTLNELYRPFRVGNVLTLANDALAAETLTGLEAGLLVTPRPRWRARGTLFAMEVDDPIANVTLSVAPQLITRQRQNIGTTRSVGLELDTEVRLARVAFTAGLLHVDAKVTGSDEGLTGLRVPQVPRSQATMGARYRAPGGGIAALEARWSASQFEDDRNLFRLGDYVVIDAYGSLPLGGPASLFAAVENMLGEEYEVGRTPVVIIGQPRSFRVGARFRK